MQIFYMIFSEKFRFFLKKFAKIRITKMVLILAITGIVSSNESVIEYISG